MPNRIERRGGRELEAVLKQDVKYRFLK